MIRGLNRFRPFVFGGARSWRPESLLRRILVATHCDPPETLEGFCCLQGLRIPGSPPSSSPLSVPMRISASCPRMRAPWVASIRLTSCKGVTVDHHLAEGDFFVGGADIAHLVVSGHLQSEAGLVDLLLVSKREIVIHASDDPNI